MYSKEQDRTALRPQCPVERSAHSTATDVSQTTGTSAAIPHPPIRLTESRAHPNTPLALLSCILAPAIRGRDRVELRLAGAL